MKKRYEQPDPKYRPTAPTPLADWLQKHGVSAYALGKAIRANPSAITSWADGRVFPTYHSIMKIAEATKDGVPAASWLGTELGRRMWSDYGINWEKWSRQRLTAMESTRAKQLKSQSVRLAERIKKAEAFEAEHGG